MTTIDQSQDEQICERLRAASDAATPVAVEGSGSKAFLGRAVEHPRLSVSGHRGVIAYEPTELVVTARGGTPLAEVEALLAERGQHLPFEPPRFGGGGTIGGAVASGLSGPARPYAGAARDFVLGTRVANGQGEILTFGGQVMKNVAGYDVSRLMTGSMGTLGAILDVSLKVLPRPRASATVAFELDAGRAVEQLNAWAATPLPVSAACHDGERLRLRLSGTAGGVETALDRLGGEREDGAEFWDRLRDQSLTWFDGDTPLWRLSVAPGAPVGDDAPGPLLVDWGGAQRWLRTEAPAASVRELAASLGGHATAFRGGDREGEVHHPLGAGLERWHRRLKSAFDPAGVLTPGRLYTHL
jgi:glycolate oxidase FAD binding subunit